MPYEFGVVVLVPFPFTDHSASKKRPAVIVSNAAYNGTRPDLVIMAITSQVCPLPTIGEVMLVRWQQAGLLKPSAIKPIFATIEQRLVIRTLGALDAAEKTTLRQAIATVLG